MQFLFTAGMSFVDSLDSVLMLYAYASPSRSGPEGKIGLFQTSLSKVHDERDSIPNGEHAALLGNQEASIGYDSLASPEDPDSGLDAEQDDNKNQVMSSLSITLTALSIVVALRYVPRLATLYFHNHRSLNCP
jgi:high-affinity nickel-transport protein